MDNSVTSSPPDILADGKQIFEILKRALSQARTEINLESFMFVSDTLGEKMAEILIERSKAGVVCRVIVDSFGSRNFDSETEAEMRDAGVQFLRFNPMRWGFLKKINIRSHRKLLIIDGDTAFIGGCGIASPWKADVGESREFRDTHFRMKGRAARLLNEHFMENWNYASSNQGGRPRKHRLKKGEIRFFEDGEIAYQLVASSPYSKPTMALRNFKDLIKQAKETLDISTPYFIPCEGLGRLLREAAARGVEVRLLIPGEITDEPVVQESARGLWGPLLKSKVQLFRYQPDFLHQKFMIVDNSLSSIGSTNIDPRSMRFNWETNLNVFSQGFARQLTDIFEQDLERSDRLTYEQWVQRPFRKKLSEFFLRPLHNYL